MAALASCTKPAETAKTIEKHEVEITDGHFTPEVMHQLGKISDPQVSPDGSRILYGVAYTSIEENRSQRHLFLMNIDGSDNHQLTHLNKGVSNARWIENGQRIAYLYDGQIWAMNPDGGGAEKISDVEGGINEFKISPDECNILYSFDFIGVAIIYKSDFHIGFKLIFYKPFYRFRTV